MHGGESDPDEGGHPSGDEDHDDKPDRWASQNAKKSPHAVETGVRRQPRHRRPGRALRGRVTERDPYLERHEPHLGGKAHDDESEGSVMERPGRNVGKGGQREAAALAGEQKEADQKGGAAHLADTKRGPACPGLGAIGAAGSGEHVKGDGQSLPAENEGKGVTSDEDDRDRAEQQEVARSCAAAGDATRRARPAEHAGRDAHAETARKCQEQPGKGVEAEGRLANAESRAKGEDALRV